MICKSWGLFIHFGVILPALALRGSGCDGLLWQGGTSSGAPLPGFWTRDHGVIWEWISCVYIYTIIIMYVYIDDYIIYVYMYRVCYKVHQQSVVGLPEKMGETTKKCL